MTSRPAPPVRLQPPEGIPAGSLLHLISRIFQELTFRSIRKWDLQANTCIVLGHLHVYPETCEPAEIAHAARLPRQTITFVLDTLEKQGLAVRQPHPTDRRRKTVHLTAKGHRRAKQVIADMVGIENAALKGLSSREAAAVRDLLGRYAVAICRQNDHEF